MKFISPLDVAAAFFSGGIDGAVKSVGDSVAKVTQAAKPTPVAPSGNEAAASPSSAQLEAAELQAATMQLGILTNSQDSQFQKQAWLTERLDTLDTKLQIAALNAKQEVSAEQNRHLEKMAALGNQFRELETRGQREADIPEPWGVS